jgi:hypothetical protein
MGDLEYKAVISTLFRLIPEAKGAYDAWDMPGDPLPYIVFSFLEQSLFTPVVNADRDPDLLRRIFEFLERMALSHDTEVINLLWVSLFEPWAVRPSTLRQAAGRMGPATKELALQAFRGITGCDLPSMS